MPTLPQHNQDGSLFSDNLLAWYDENARMLPWRYRWPDLADPYDVFLSELMLQQTVVATVIPYFLKFKAIWPTITDLAACNEADLLREWAGLGYYARARNMRKAAIIIAQDFAGQFPENVSELQKLPGIGPYTAAAIAAFAFDKPAIVIDGNIERVMSRYLGEKTPLPELKEVLRAAYPDLQPATRHSDFPQAIMDLGARICISGKPRCQLCPLQDKCQMAFSDVAETLPVKPKKQPKPHRKGAIFVAISEDKAVMIRRPDKGLLGGMMVFPTFGWLTSSQTGADITDAPFAANWQDKGIIRHVFTHFTLELTIYAASWSQDASYTLPEDMALVEPQAQGLSSVMKKVWQAAQQSDS